MHLLKAGVLGFGSIVPLVLARLYRFEHRAAAIDVNEAEAVRWYKRAIEQGSVEAAAELQGFYKELEKRKREGASASIHRLPPFPRTEP
jgi:TPR repeat protein